MPVDHACPVFKTITIQIASRFHGQTILAFHDGSSKQIQAREISLRTRNEAAEEDDND